MIAVAGALLVAVLGLLVIGGSGPLQVGDFQVSEALANRVQPGGTGTTFIQPTDHPIRVPPTSSGLQWYQATGQWGTLANQAYVSRAAEEGVAAPPALDAAPDATNPPALTSDNLLVLSVPTDGIAELVIASVAPGAGLVFRYEDPQDYLAVVVSPDGAGWEFVRVLDGVAETEPITAPSPEDGAYLSVAYNGPTVDVSLDGRAVFSATAEDWTGTDAGLIVRGPEGTGPKGAMFNLFLANPPPGVVPEGVPTTAASVPALSIPS